MQFFEKITQVRKITVYVLCKVILTHTASRFPFTGPEN